MEDVLEETNEDEKVDNNIFLLTQSIEKSLNVIENFMVRHPEKSSQITFSEFMIWIEEKMERGLTGNDFLCVTLYKVLHKLELSFSDDISVRFKDLMLYYNQALKDISEQVIQKNKEINAYKEIIKKIDIKLSDLEIYKGRYFKYKELDTIIKNQNLDQKALYRVIEIIKQEYGIVDSKPVAAIKGFDGK